MMNAAQQTPVYRCSGPGLSKSRRRSRMYLLGIWYCTGKYIVTNDLFPELEISNMKQNMNFRMYKLYHLVILIS